jgi:hypothetical protein
MQIAKIVNSRSHIEYSARVLDTLEVERPPRPSDYAFGNFVVVESEGQKIVGVIANSQLINPEYGNFGPRLSTPPESNRIFSPDYLHDQGVLVGLLMLGSLGDGYGIHGTPDLVLPVHAPVSLLDRTGTGVFHRDESGKLRLGYYSLVVGRGGAMAGELMLLIIERLQEGAEPADRARLALLRRNLAWQQTIGVIR